jgi:hypothetical protein
LNVPAPLLSLTVADFHGNLELVWKSEIGDQGGGQWERQSPAKSDGFWELAPSRAPASISTPEAAYLFGGYVRNDTTCPIKVLYKYKFDWRERSWDTEFRYLSRNIWGPTAAHVPGFGTGRAFIPFSGKTGANTVEKSFLSFDTAYI